MRRVGRPPLVLAVAGVLAVLSVLAGCTSAPDQDRRVGDTVADLRARAAMAPCPTPDPPSTATGTPRSTASTASTASTRSATPDARAAPAASASLGSSASSVTPRAPTSPGASPDAGRELPRGTFRCMAGGPDVPLHRITGVPLVINLWATWCLPCRTELPAFQAAFDHADPGRLRVLGVATEDPGLTRQLSFAADTGLRMPNLVDDRGVLAGQLGVRGLPATLFVDPDGSLVHVYNGPPLTFPALRDLVARYLRVTIRG